MPTTLNSIMADLEASSAAAGGPPEVTEHRKSSSRTAKEESAYGAGGGVSVVAAEMEEPPTRAEVAGWYVYGLCSYFVHAFLLPVLFPLVVAQRALPASKMPPPPSTTSLGVACHRNDTLLYQMVIRHSISVNHSKFSPLHWTAISWFVGVVVTAPLLPKLAQHLDRGFHQPLILGAGTVVGALVCLLTGFFDTTWLYPFFIAIITVAVVAASAVHTRHLGLIVRGIASDGAHRKALISSRMSLNVTACGNFGTAVIALFTYHMLRRADHLTSLWVVAIFCGLKWFLGFTETFFATRPGSSSTSVNLVSPYWPYVVGCLGGVFLSSFSSICLFTSATLYIVGSLCMRPVFLLAVWMVYFLFGVAILPAMHPLQLLIRADPMKMNLFGLILSAIAAGCGFYFKHDKWHWVPILLVTLLQSAGAGILHAFGRVMILDRSPPGREGLFASWYEWVKLSGACAGFALAAVCPDDIHKTFGLSFLAVFIGIIVLIFGSDLSSFTGGFSVKRQLDKDENEIGSSENGLNKHSDLNREYIGGTRSKLDDEGHRKQEGGGLQV